MKAARPDAWDPASVAMSIPMGAATGARNTGGDMTGLATTIAMALNIRQSGRIYHIFSGWYIYICTNAQYILCIVYIMYSIYIYTYDYIYCIYIIVRGVYSHLTTGGAQISTGISGQFKWPKWRLK